MSDSFDRLLKIMDRLRDPGGCPWDQEQSLQTLAGYLLEETHEVVDAVASGDPDQLREELGDLLIQVVFMARIGREKGWFDIGDVCDGISDKMVHRHPHVFAERQVQDSKEVLRNWEEIKRLERKKTSRTSALDGVPNSLPALLKAFRMTEKAAALGFDWRRTEDVLKDLRAEVDELEAELCGGTPPEPERVRDELGDVLFVFANLARHLGVEPETALQGTNSKFLGRFQAMEAIATAEGRSLGEMSLDELDALWDRVKAEAAAAATGAPSTTPVRQKPRRR